MGEPIRGLEGLGAYLRKIRVSRKLSLDSVAELTGGFKDPVTKSHLSRVENGLAEPSFRRLYALCQVYKLNLTSLAEQYELGLRQEEIEPLTSNRLAPGEMLLEASELRRAGDYATALAMYEMLLVQETIELDGMSHAQTVLQLEIYRVNCLIQMAFFHAAREQLETLLDHAELTGLQRAHCVHFMAVTAWRQGKREYAAILLKDLTESAAEIKEDRLYPSILWTRGNIAVTSKKLDEALACYQEASRRYGCLEMKFQDGFVRRLLADVYTRKKKFRKSREILQGVLTVAEANGYEKQTALILSDLAFIAWQQEELPKAESYCRRSNALARPREYIDLVFRNCFILWKIADITGNVQSLKINLRTLRTYQGRVNETLDELHEFKREVSGGVA
jgi:transcriptional regulator with XRE-family HTH domain